MVLLKEYYNNTIEEQVEEEKQKNEENPDKDENSTIKINGELIVYPYDEVEYSIEGTDGGYWEINSTKAMILNQTPQKVSIGVTTGRSGEFDLFYKKDGEEDIVMHITIESL